MALDEILSKHSTNCSNKDFEVNGGFHVCTVCGLCIKPLLVNKFRRTFTKEESDKKLHNEKVYKSYGCRTKIGDWKIKDVSGKYIPGEQKALYKRLQSVQKSSNSSLEVNFKIRDSMFRNFGSKAPRHILDAALKIYNTSYRKNLMRGRSIEGFVISSIYAGMRILKHPVFLGQFIIDSDFDFAANDVMGYLSVMNKNGVFRELGYKLQKPVIPWGEIETKLNKGYDNHEQIITTGEVYSVMKKFNKIPEQRKIGKDVKGVIAGLAYLEFKDTDKKRTQSFLAKAFNITEVTLRNRTNDIN